MSRLFTRLPVDVAGGRVNGSAQRKLSALFFTETGVAFHLFFVIILLLFRIYVPGWIRDIRYIKENIVCGMCGISLVVKRDLPKVELWVRFPYTA